MPQVRMPDGTVVAFPDDMPADQIRSMIATKFPEIAPKADAAQAPAPAAVQQQEAPATQPWYAQAGQAADDIARLIANGASFGYADKLAGYMNGTGTEAERDLSQQAKERAGSAGTVAELGGAIATPVGMAGRGLTLMRGAPMAMKGAGGLLARTGLMAGEGAGYGALTAAGNDQDIATGAGIGAIGGGLGNVAGEALSSVGGKVAGLLNKKPAVMSADQLSAAKNAAYQKVDNLGVQYKPEAFDDLVKGMTDEVKAANISPMRHPKAASMMEEIQSLAGSSPTITQLDQLRQVIRRDVANSNDPAEAFFGKKMIKNIDEFIDAAGPNQVVAGNADEAARAIANARDLNTRVRKLASVDDAVESARLRAASTGSGGNVDNATRQNLRRVLEKGHFTDDERAALEKAVTGTKGQDLLRLAGKLSPSGNGLMAALGIGGTMVNPLVGAASLGGMAAKALADNVTSKNVSEIARIIAAGGSRAATRAPKNALQTLAESKRDAIVRALMGIGVHEGVAP